MSLPRATTRSYVGIALALIALPVGGFYVAQDAGIAPAADAEASGAPATPTFSTPVNVVNNYAFEPSVRVARDGTVYVAMARAFPNPSWLWYSLDNGATWLKSPNPPGMRGAEPEISLAEDGTLYFSDLYVGNVVVGWYKNRGATLAGWTAIGEASAAVDRQWIAVGPKAATGGHALFVNTNDVGRGVMQYFTPDITAAPAVKPAPIVVGGGPSYPVAYDPVKRWAYTVYEATGVLVARTSTGTQALPTRFAVSGESSGIANVFPSVAVDKAGNVFAVWSAQEGSEFKIQLMWSTNEGATWNGPVAVSPPGGTHVFPWIAANEPGRIAIAWYGSDDVGHPHSLTSSAWQVRFAQSIDVLSGNPTFARVKATPTVHTGSICIAGISCDPPSGNVDRDLGDYLQVTIAPDGMAHVAYTDDVGTDGRVYHMRQTGGAAS